MQPSRRPDPCVRDVVGHVQLRPVVAGSWRRSEDSGVRRERNALPDVKLDGDRLAAERIAHPLSGTLETCRDLLADTVRATGSVFAVDLTGGKDIGGAHALAAVRATARAMEAELARRLHPRDLRSWDAYAELIRSGTVPTALVSPGGRVLHVDPGMPSGSMPTSRRIGEKLLPDGARLVAEEVGEHGYLVVRRVGGRWAHPTVDVRLSALGVDNALVEAGGRKLRLSPRHSEILLVLAGEGMSAGRLAVELSSAELSTVAVRANISRLLTVLRSSIGVDLLGSQPYRIGVEVHCDIHTSGR